MIHSSSLAACVIGSSVSGAISTASSCVCPRLSMSSCGRTAIARVSTDDRRQARSARADMLHQVVIEEAGIQVQPRARRIPAAVLLVREERPPRYPVLAVAGPDPVLVDADLLHEDRRPLVQRLCVLDGVGERPVGIAAVWLAGHWLAHASMLTHTPQGDIARCWQLSEDSSFPPFRTGPPDGRTQTGEPPSAADGTRPTSPSRPPAGKGPETEDGPVRAAADRFRPVAGIGPARHPRAGERAIWAVAEGIEPMTRSASTMSHRCFFAAEREIGFGSREIAVSSHFVL
jgi:hypothetical protein